MRLRGGADRKAANLRLRRRSARAKWRPARGKNAVPDTRTTFQNFNDKGAIFPLARVEGLRHFHRVLGGTAALHSHSTVGGCTFFAPILRIYGLGIRPILRNSGLCQPQVRQRQGRRHFPMKTASHTMDQRPAVRRVSSRCRRLEIRAWTNTDSCLQWGQ
jgi:hypothetical protein